MFDFGREKGVAVIACPKCNGTEFLGGPRGGLAQDILCKKCGAEFCDAGPFGLEELPRDEDRANLYGLKSLPKQPAAEIVGQGGRGVIPEEPCTNARAFQMEFDEGPWAGVIVFLPRRYLAIRMMIPPWGEYVWSEKAEGYRWVPDRKESGA